MDRYADRVVPDFESVDPASKPGLRKAIDVADFKPPSVALLRLDTWHQELQSYMNGVTLVACDDEGRSLVTSIP